MPFFSRQPNRQEVRDFGRGRRSSARAAEQYAQDARDRAATRRALAERRAAERRGRR